MTAKLPEPKSLPPLAPKTEFLGEPNAYAPPTPRPCQIWNIDPDEGQDFEILKVGGCQKLSTWQGKKKGQQWKQPPVCTVWKGKGT